MRGLGKVTRLRKLQDITWLLQMLVIFLGEGKLCLSDDEIPRFI